MEAVQSVCERERKSAGFFSAFVLLSHSDEWDPQSVYCSLSVPAVRFLDLAISVYFHPLTQKADSFCSIFNCWIRSQPKPFMNVNGNVWPPVHPSICLHYYYYYLFVFGNCVHRIRTVFPGLSGTHITHLNFVSSAFPRDTK